MSKKMIVSGATVLILAGIYAGATFYTGNQIQKQMPVMIENANLYLQAKNIPYTLVVSDVKQGFFSSQAKLTLQSEQMPELSFDVTTKNGPLPGFSQFGMVAFEATLNDDASLKEIFETAQAPILVTADGRISFAGDLNMGIAISPLGKSIGMNELDINSDKITLAIDYQKNNTFTWQASTPKLSLTQLINRVQSSLVLEGITLSGENKPNASGLNDVVHSIKLDKVDLINGAEPRFSGKLANLQATSTLTSKDELAGASYKIDAKDIKFGNIEFNELNLLAAITNMPVSSLAEQNQFAAYFMPMILNQATTLNDEAVLSTHPKLDISSLEMSNQKGLLAGQASVEFNVAKKPEASTRNAEALLKGLPLSSALIDVKADKSFLTDFISQFNQMNLGIEKEKALKSAEEMLASILEMSQLYGGILNANDTQVTFNLSIENGVGKLNQAPLTEQRMGQLLGVMFAPSPFKTKEVAPITDEDVSDTPAVE
ncbi:YdgA family protein [Thorsellia anophelis]|uniref:Uncharacterized conserved protein YdgA, DUF945 family n=1 Tax=Thorsellia anophelis DSM 18579 TaxID=1123402 RepID=A0A1I0BCP8_9GAMM|nr:DUF945 family protein [Thorsellia anophelis]SET03954.1 Uncharacterized conserved protein YdgA, DUF945 family [Thorsellia anophelis DSM 18579]